jgi:lipase chaperone LimK
LTRKKNRIFGEEEEPYFVREEEESKLKLELKKQSELASYIG